MTGPSAGVGEVLSGSLKTAWMIPVLGLGVWQLAEGRETEQAVEWALEAGYRHGDTATYYRNQPSVGAALHLTVRLSGPALLLAKLTNSRLHDARVTTM